MTGNCMSIDAITPFKTKTDPAGDLIALHQQPLLPESLEHPGCKAV